MKNGQLLKQRGNLIAKAESSSSSLESIAQMIATDINESQVSVNNSLTDALGDYRGEMKATQQVVIEETFYESGALQSRKAIVQKESFAIRE